MKKIGLQRQQFSSEFKSSVLKKVCSGELTGLEASKQYGIGRSTIYRWLSKLSSCSNNINLEIENATNLSKNKKDQPDRELLEHKIRALEASLEEARLRVEAYQTMIEIAEQEFSIQIGKKSGTKQSQK